MAISPCKKVWSFSLKTLILYTQGRLVPRLVEIGPLVLEIIFKSRLFLLGRFYFALKKDMTLHLKYFVHFQERVANLCAAPFEHEGVSIVQHLSHRHTFKIYIHVHVRGVIKKFVDCLDKIKTP